MVICTYLQKLFKCSRMACLRVVFWDNFFSVKWFENRKRNRIAVSRFPLYIFSFLYINMSVKETPCFILPREFISTTRRRHINKTAFRIKTQYKLKVTRRLVGIELYIQTYSRALSFTKQSARKKIPQIFKFCSCFQCKVFVQIVKFIRIFTDRRFSCALLFVCGSLISLFFTCADFKWKCRIQICLYRTNCESYSSALIHFYFYLNFELIHVNVWFDYFSVLSQTCWR